MTTIKISELLSKFKKITPPNYLIKINLPNIIFKYTKININKKNIKVNNQIIYLQEKAIIKNEIFLKKETILKELNSKINIKILNIK